MSAVTLPGRPGARTRGAKMAALAAVTAALGLGGCTGFGIKPGERPATVSPAQLANAEAARQYLETMQQLLDATPAAQAELVGTARQNAETAPTTMHRLRYALLLATPAHGGADPVAARRQLSDLLARPELLLPAERALAALVLRDVDERLGLIAENRRLQQESATRDQQRAVTANRRLQAEIEENARLRRALDEAQKKLDAVTQLERSIVERGGSQGKP
jgi:hypothetical protein